jgi:hypothetical protein
VKKQLSLSILRDTTQDIQVAALRYIRRKLGSMSYQAHVTSDDREDNDDNDIIIK